LKESNISGDMLFYLAGYEYDLKWNEYAIRLNQYSNNETFLIQ
jgi:hypothetical protein